MADQAGVSVAVRPPVEPRVRGMVTEMIQRGYLVLADLSGFTSFVATTELDHAQKILADLLTLLRGRLTPVLELAEVEGDALFLYAPDQRITRGEMLFELLESAYVGFRDRVRTMERNATCPCLACRSIPALDLKFVTHWGEWVLQDLSGRAKPFGTSVNLAHRLLKNAVAEATGWSAYALFTEATLERMGVAPEDMHAGIESYPHLGEWPVRALDLRRRYAALTADRMAFLAEGDAHVTERRRYALPVATLWDLLNDPVKRNVWEIGSDWSAERRPGGRLGVGAHNHCANSDFIEEILDWRPFDYYTVQLRGGPVRLRVTGELRPDGEATELRWSAAMEGRLPRAVRALACRFLVRRLMRQPERFDRLDRMFASGTPPQPV